MTRTEGDRGFSLVPRPSTVDVLRYLIERSMGFGFSSQILFRSESMILLGEFKSKIIKS